MKLHPNTPEPYILFMAGSLGAKADVHLKQLSLFGMITRLPNNIIYKIAFTKLSSDPDSSSSWFVQVRKLCAQYGLPSPLSLLSNPPSKCTYNSTVKKHVVDYWEQLMRNEAASKTSLAYCNATNMSLTTPHPLWTTSGSNPFEINKSIIVARLLSGRYRSDYLTRHWSKDNPSGFCVLCPDKKIPGTIEHMLVSCDAFGSKREDLFLYWEQQSEDNPKLHFLLSTMLSSSTQDFVQFLLDPSVVQIVLDGCQLHHYTLCDVFSLTRTFCYGIHRRRQQLIGRFSYRL